MVGEGVAVAREVERRRARTLFIGGALTQEFVDDFTRVLPPRHELRVVVRDATVLVLPAASVAASGVAASSSRCSRKLQRARRHGQPLPCAAAVSAQGCSSPRSPTPSAAASPSSTSSTVLPPFHRWPSTVRRSLPLTKEGGPVNDALRLDADLVERARAAADAIADDIQQHIEEHTTDTTERATLRLLGISGVNEIDVPLVNVVVEHAGSCWPAASRCPSST